MQATLCAKRQDEMFSPRLDSSVERVATMAVKQLPPEGGGGRKGRGRGVEG